MAPPRRIVLGVSLVVLVMVVAVVVWPGLSRRGDRLDVLVVGDSGLVGRSDQLQRRLHERGLSTAVVAVPDSMCEALPALRQAVADEQPQMVVMSVRRAEVADCGPVASTLPPGATPALDPTAAAWGAAVEAAGGRRVMLVVQPGPAPDGQDAAVRAAIVGLEPRRDVIVADPSTLLGEAVGSPAAMACQWWDTCGPDGFVAVRQPEGALTDAGSDRVARVVVGAMP